MQFCDYLGEPLRLMHKIGTAAIVWCCACEADSVVKVKRRIVAEGWTFTPDSRCSQCPLH